MNLRMYSLSNVRGSVEFDELSNSVTFNGVHMLRDTSNRIKLNVTARCVIKQHEYSHFKRGAKTQSMSLQANLMYIAVK